MVIQPFLWREGGWLGMLVLPLPTAWLRPASSMPAADHFADQLGERDEIDDRAAIDVGPGDRNCAARADSLGDLEDMLGSGRSDGDDHDTAGLQLLQERRWNMVDAAGDDNLVEGRFFRPSVIAVGVLGGYRL